MIHSHLVALLAFSSLTATALATLLRDGARNRLRFGLKAFAAFLLSAALVGWLMYPFPN